MSKAFAEKVLDTIYAKAQPHGGECIISRRQFEIVSEYLENTGTMPDGHIPCYYGNLGKYHVELQDERWHGCCCNSIELRPEEEVEAERKAEAEAQAKKDAIMEGFRNGNYIGQPKERMDLSLTLVSERQFDGRYGRTNCYNFADEQGNCIVWFTQNALCMYFEERDEWGYAEVGSKVTMRATVKEHGEYRGIKQTVITRPQIKAIA